MVISNWSFIEVINIDSDFLLSGLETPEKIRRQLDVDVPRLRILVNGKQITKAEQITSNNMNMLRCCTQSVFFKPLEYLMNIFPDFHIIHERTNEQSKIDITVRKEYVNGILSYIGLIEPNVITECSISTIFSVRRKHDMKECFQIFMQFIFDVESNKGNLIFHNLSNAINS